MALTKVRGSGLDSSQEGAITFNEGSAVVDFRVESNGNANMLFVDAGNDKVGVGTGSPATPLHVSGASGDILTLASSSGTELAIKIDGNEINFRADADNDESSSMYTFDIDDSEKMRMDNSGRLLIGNTDYNNANTGVLINGATGLLFATASEDAPAKINRKTSDGELVELLQDTSKEGSLSVSGSTVSLVGFSGQHESSGIATNTAVGTVVSTIDELDTYATGTSKEGQTRADHPKVKVSDTEGDKAVYGVVDRFNSDNKVIVSAVGIAPIKVTGACARGDLLESNGDGTAKVQSDDIIRSKTIGKVTIGNSSSSVKLVSCVLYCG